MTYPLRYRSGVTVDDLQAGECTIHRATNAKAARWWLLWIYAPRDTDGQLEFFAVPVVPHAAYTENGPGGRSWGLMPQGSSTPETHCWAVSPSINVLDDRDAVSGKNKHPSVWHHDGISLVDVPDTEPWTSGGPA